MKYRIKKYAKGFVVESQKTKWYGKKYWSHAIGVSGMKQKPWFYSTFEAAENNLLDNLDIDTDWYSPFSNVI